MHGQRTSPSVPAVLHCCHRREPQSDSGCKPRSQEARGFLRPLLCAAGWARCRRGRDGGAATRGRALTLAHPGLTLAPQVQSRGAMSPPALGSLADRCIHRSARPRILPPFVSVIPLPLLPSSLPAAGGAFLCLARVASRAVTGCCALNALCQHFCRLDQAHPFSSLPWPTGPRDIASLTFPAARPVTI